jgi:hypothetical protein
VKVRGDKFEKERSRKFEQQRRAREARKGKVKRGAGNDVVNPRIDRINGT